MASPRTLTPEQLVAEHRSLVESQSALIRKRYARSVELEELIGYAVAGLLVAAKRYDEQQLTAFATFAYYRVRGAVFDGLRAMGKLSRRALEAERRERAATDAAELAGEMIEADGGARDSREWAGMAIGDTLGRMTASYVFTLIEQQSRPDPEEALIEADEKWHLARAIDELPPKDAELLRLVCLEGMTQEAVAAKLGVERSTISKRIQRAQQRMREALQR